MHTAVKARNFLFCFFTKLFEPLTIFSDDFFGSFWFFLLYLLLLVDLAFALLAIQHFPCQLSVQLPPRLLKHFSLAQFLPQPLLSLLIHFLAQELSFLLLLYWAYVLAKALASDTILVW